MIETDKITLNSGQIAHIIPEVKSLFGLKEEDYFDPNQSVKLSADQLFTITQKTPEKSEQVFDAIIGQIRTELQAISYFTSAPDVLEKRQFSSEKKINFISSLLSRVDTFKTNIENLQRIIQIGNIFLNKYLASLGEIGQDEDLLELKRSNPNLRQQILGLKAQFLNTSNELNRVTETTLHLENQLQDLTANNNQTQ